VVGDLATHVARDAAGFAGGDFVVEDGTMEVVDPSLIVRERRRFDPGQAAPNVVLWLPGGSRLDPSSLAASGTAGRDLLWTGSFEDEEADGRDAAAPLWLSSGDGRTVGADAAAAGLAGIRVSRTAGNVADAVLQPGHRIVIEKGARLTFIARVRPASVAAHVTLQFGWYNDLQGTSAAQSTVPLPAAGPEWTDIRVDLVGPVNGVAVLPLIRLGPPAVGRTYVDIDNVRLIQWTDASAATEADDYLRLAAETPFELVQNSLPGGTGGIDDPIVISGGTVIELPAPPPLPPIPSDSPFGDDL
jgi:poly-gamma-glutamate synthesis protein (capsule biosynthesis protein)